MLLEDYRFTIGSSRILFTSETKPISSFMAISTIFAMMTRADALQMDIHFNVGLVNIIGTCLLAAAINMIASSLFIRTWRYEHGNSYADIVKDTFRHGQYIVRLIYIIALVYSSMLMIHHIETTIDSILVPYIGSETFYTNPNFLQYCIIPIFTVPLFLISQFVQLRFYLVFANIATIIMLAVMIYFFVRSVKNDGFDPEKKQILYSGKFWDTIHGMATWLVIFWGQPFMCVVAKSLPKKTQKSVINTMIVSILVAVIVNFSISLFGHLYYWGSTDEELMINFYPEKNIISNIGQSANLINCLITNGCYIYLAASEIVSMFGVVPTKLLTLISILTIEMFCRMCTEYFRGQNEHIFEMVGNISFLIMSLVLPPITYLKAFKLKEKWGYISIFFVIFAVAISAGIVYVHLLE